MRKSRFTEEQIAMALRQAEAGTTIEEICRKLGVSSATYFRWKKKYGGLGDPELRELRQLREENRRAEGDGGRPDAGPDDAAGGPPKKMVRPCAAPRNVAAWGDSAYRVRRAQACSVFGRVSRTVRYKSRKPSQEPLRQRLRELAAARVHAGYQQLHVYLRREGWKMNHKRILRLYRRRRAGAAATGAASDGAAQLEGSSDLGRRRPNELWAMDFMHDTLADGKVLRVLTGVDMYTWECMALEAGRSFSGADGRTNPRGGGRGTREASQRIRVDNGTEFTSKSLDAWAYWNHVELDFSRPGKPGDNAFAESFNSIVRRECLSQHWFQGLGDAQSFLRRWRDEYNNERPHSSLGLKTPAQYRAGRSEATDRIEARTVAQYRTRNGVSRTGPQILISVDRLRGARSVSRSAHRKSRSTATSRGSRPMTWDSRSTGISRRPAAFATH